MKLNHLNLTVTDIKATRELLARHFGMTHGGGSDKSIAFMRDDNGMVLTLFRSPEPVRYPMTFHIGFIQPSAARVDEINAALKADGYDVPPPSRQHGSWPFYFEAPGGFVIEVLS